MTVRMWDIERGQCLAVFPGHTEFAVGVDWSLFGEGWIGSVGWDGRVCIAEWTREWKKLA
jgi:WD40 repeat protein